MAEAAASRPDTRQIRVFLSSTFVDFMEERELLVKRVFPALNRRARDRGVELIDVDLRWGVTEEQTKQGQTLPLCLGEIDRCRPYFIGLLGERHGWVPPADFYKPELLERQPWLRQHQGGASVTELEILHGVLRNPEMAGYARFYLRDPAYALAQEDPTWLAEGEEERQRLQALKEQVRASRLPVVEGLSDPKAIASRIEADLWELIEERFPEQEQLDALEREERQHASYRRSRLAVYLGGRRSINQLERWIDAGQQKILITGESGAGKSALIANWIEAHQQHHPEDVVFAHHLGCSNDASAIRPLLARLIDTAKQQLPEIYGDSLSVPQDWWELVDKAVEALQSLGRWSQQNNHRWIWVLDGLDRLDQDDQDALPWLPITIPEGVVIVASALECPAREILLERKFKTRTIAPLKAKEQDALIKQYLGRYTKQLIAELRNAILSHPLAGSPLFLRVLLEELRQCGRYETLADQLAGYLSAETIDDLYELVLERLEADANGENVRKVMTALWASRAGLSEEELLSITGLAPLQWAPIDLALEEALGRNGNRLVFDHDYLRKAVEDRYLPAEEERRQAHSELADWYWKNEKWDERTAEELPWQWQHADRLEDLRNHLLNSAHLAALAYCRGNREVINYWLTAKGEGDSELDELIADKIDNEIKKRRKNKKDLIWFLDWIAGIFDEAGWYREPLLRLRALSLELEEASEEKDEESMLTRLELFADANRDLGDYDAALPLYQRCLEASERLLGPEHPDTLTTVNNLGGLYRLKGDYEQAESYYKRNLEARERLLGPEHPDTITTVANLGALLKDQADYEQAEAYLKRALELVERQLGPEHPSTLGTVGNLGLLYTAKGDYEQAEAYYTRCLEAEERLLGPEHPDTLNTVGNLAGLYRCWGDLERAETLFVRCAESFEQQLGQKHPNAITACGNLGLFYSENGNYEQAEIFLKRDLEASEQLLGPEHPSTLTTASNLGLLYNYTGDYERSEIFCNRCLEARQRLLGPNHHDTLISINNMGLLYSNNGDDEKAEVFYKRALEALERLLGPEHPDTLMTVSNLAGLFQDKGDYEQAESLYRRCLQGREQALGTDNSYTLGTAYNLADVLSQQERRTEAIPLRRRELAWCREQNGDTDPGTLASINALAIDLRENGALEEAEALFRELVAARLQVLEPEDFQIGRALGGLAKTLEEAGKLEEAFDYSQQALDHRLAHEGPDALWTNRKRLDLARVLHKLERHTDASALLNELQESMVRNNDPYDDDRQLISDAEELMRAIEEP